MNAKNDKTLVVITVSKVRPFEAIFGNDPNDSRMGTFYSDVTMAIADDDGNHIKCLDTHGCIHSGLRETADEAHYAALDQARAAKSALRAIGKSAYLVDENSKYADNDDYLAGYLRQKEWNRERKAEAAELKRQAMELLQQARILTA